MSVVPDLGRDKKNISRNATLSDGLAHTAFIYEDRSGVGMAITKINGSSNRFDDHFLRYQEDPESIARNLIAGMQWDGVVHGLA